MTYKDIDISLLGTKPDSYFAKIYGVNPSTIGRLRKKHNIPSWHSQGKIVVNCATCGKEIVKYRCELERKDRIGQKFYCSKECQHEGLKLYSGDTYIEVKCDYCGNIFKKRYCKYVKNKKHYCSKECAYGGKPASRKIEVKCDYCGNTIKIKERKYKEQKHFFCNRECYRRYNVGKNHPNYKERIITYCEWCGKELIREQWQKKNHPMSFCSLECEGKWMKKYQVGENNVNWRGGYDGCYGLKVEEWCAIKNTVRKRDNYTCQNCGAVEKDGETFHVHHIIKYRLTQDNSNNNLITICPMCHKLIVEPNWEVFAQEWNIYKYLEYLINYNVSAMIPQ